MPSSNSSSVTMEEEDKGAAGRGGGGGGRAAQSDLNRIMEKKKTWSELKQIVRESRRTFSTPSSPSATNSAGSTSTSSPPSVGHIRTPTLYTFRALPLLSKTRLYFLSSAQIGKESTLLYVDIEDTGGAPATGDQVLQWSSLIEPTFQVAPTPGKVSKEEMLMWERMRCVAWGITHYELHKESGRFVFPAANSLFGCVDDGVAVGGGGTRQQQQTAAVTANSSLFPYEIKSTCSSGGARLNSVSCPSNPDLVAYCCSGDVWVTNVVTGQEERLTFSSRCNPHAMADGGGVEVPPPSEDPLSAGLPSYVMQEEFNRFTGFFWRPVHDSSDTTSTYTLLYEEVDESMVELLKFVCPYGPPGDVEEFRFPRAGFANAKSVLRTVSFELDGEDRIVAIRGGELKVPLESQFELLEYIVRMGWTPDGQNVWAQILDRPQQSLGLVLLPFHSFLPVNELPNGHATPLLDPCTEATEEYSASPYRVIFSVQSESWITVTNLLRFLPVDDPDLVRFIWASEETGFMHLYLVEALKRSNVDEEAAEADCSVLAQPRIVKKVALTSGPWAVIDKEVYVDEALGLVYFHGLKDSPLEKHLYVVSMNQPGHVRRLTIAGYSHSAHMNSDCTMFVTSFSSIQSAPASQVFKVGHKDATAEGVVLATAGWVVEPRPLEKDYQPPELFSHKISSGDKLYGMMFKPKNMVVGRKYPVVLSVYGGPEVQLVTNTFKGIRQIRSHLLASQGYIVISIDSRGSLNRGVAFESHIRHRMGQVELADQVEVMSWLGSVAGYLDLDRVAVHGWSYGGYLSLMALAQFPKLFKVAVAGAPVSNWSAYDTGYTERYMGLPAANVSGYRLGSVLNYVNDFPDEPNRLLIVHGIMDENVHFYQHTSQLISHLIRLGKPYQLQIFPTERHSLRHMEASDHYETTLLSFLQNNL